MSTLYLSTCEESLARRLAESLDDAEGDWFTPATIIVPSAYLGKWLRLKLARQLGIVANVRFKHHLEEQMGELLKQVDDRMHPLPLTVLNEDQYRLMVLGALLDREGQRDDPFRAYLGKAEERSRDFWRRAWQLSGRLSSLIRDYEYHRQADLIQKWLKHEEGDPYAARWARDLERGQRDLFEQIVREPDGLRARLQQPLRCIPKTLPQYANEVMELPADQLRTFARPPIVHLFGLSQISSLHVRTLRWLGERFDVRVYHLNPLIGRWDRIQTKPEKARQALRQLADRFRVKPLVIAQPVNGGDELVEAWGQAGAEGLGLMADLLEGPRPFRIEIAPPTLSPKQTSVLGRVQENLKTGGLLSERIPQDCSLQVVACPGVYREVETVCQSILHNLGQDASLKQTDIAVLATDMVQYRPVIQAVFERNRKHISYCLADYSAAELSPYGHAVLGIMDLALESFTRSRVLNVLMNPCFLARLGVERDHVQCWPGWVETLGIYHGWDSDDKKERGYAESPIHTWQLGLRRLRLGKLMDVPAEAWDGPTPHFCNVIPFANVETADHENLETFVRALDRFLPRLQHLRTLNASAATWAETLQTLFDDFLAIPEDQPSEKSVRASLSAALNQFKLLDAVRGEPVREDLALAVVREFVGDSLETLKARKGDPLVAGVTVAALSSLMPVPFKIIYVLGLGEGLFPGSNQLPALDLRNRKRCAGDILPAETNRFHLSQAMLAAKQKIYLLYNCRELQKDQELHPCGPVNQLLRFLKDEVIKGGHFEVAHAPLLGSDLRLLPKPDSKAPFDALVNYSIMDRLLAICEAKGTGEIELTSTQDDQVEKRLVARRRTFTVPIERRPDVAKDVVISLSQLRDFLRCPAESTLKRHLGLYDDADAATADVEPLYTNHLVNAQLVKEALNQFLAVATAVSIEEAHAHWRRQFRRLFEEWRLRGRLPDGAFGQVSRQHFEQQLQAMIERPSGLAGFLRERADAEFCGPVVLGETASRLKPGRRLAAVSLGKFSGETLLLGKVSLAGSQSHVWRSCEAIDLLVLTNKEEKKVPSDQLSMPLLEPALFYLTLRAAQWQQDYPDWEWLGNRIFRIHVLHKTGTSCFSYFPDDFPADVARNYLVALTKDYQDRSAFDLLPFELIKETKELRGAYQAKSAKEWTASEKTRYAGALIESFVEDQEGAFGRTYYPMDLLQIAEPKVPEDALDKVYRRFHLLDRGPACNR